MNHTNDCRDGSRTDRSDALRIVARIVGEGGIPAFLRTQQPALGDRTGAQLLQTDPAKLLGHLRKLEASIEDFDEAPPRTIDRGCRRSGAEVNKLLSLIDSLAPGIGDFRGEAG